MKFAPTLRRALSRALIVLVAATAAACAEGPDARYETLKKAVELDDFEAFSDHFTLASNAAMRDMFENGKRSRIHYLKDWKKLVPVGDLEEVEVRGQVAFLKIAGAKTGGKELRMLREHDAWCVDLEGLQAYWEPLKGKTP
jgi:hypothetical protein